MRGVLFGSFMHMLGGVGMVTVSQMSMMGSRVVLALAMMLCRSLVMFRRAAMVLGSLTMMFN